MDWPQHPVETLARDGAFRPPHCPWADCPSRTRPADHPFRCIRHGFYTRHAAPRRIPRWRCRVCRRTFSSQTFAVTYYLKHPERLLPCASGVCIGASFGQLAEHHGGHRSAWARLSERIGRHALRLHALLLDEIARRGLLDEPVVYDHLETFAGCQDYPVGVGLAAGTRSRFVLSVDEAPHARPRRHPWERRRRDARYRRWGRPPRGGYRRAATATRRRLLALLRPGATLELVSDDHPAYRAAFDRCPRIRRTAYPNPPARRRGQPRDPATRARDRALWLVDVLDKLVRHETAGHKRETIAHMRRHACLMLRAFVNVVRRNLVMTVSKRRGRPFADQTPAVRLGLVAERWSWARVFARRIFPWEVDLPPDWDAFCRKTRLTPMVGRNTIHDLRHAD